MPEGPELRMNSLFINNICHGLLFSGRPIRSSVSKSPEVEWDSSKYTITSESRGKELALYLHCQEIKKSSLRILFRFGMSGKFVFTRADGIPKHSHLQFHTVSGKGEEPNVLSFLDVRRFGSWHVMEGWGEDRGPDIINEYDQFRTNILENLNDPVFKKPICETMLNQKYFNGIGNYLRAEILYRAKVPPFECSRTVLGSLKEVAAVAEPRDDVLKLCRDISQEVIQLKIGLGKAERMTESVSKEDHEVFLKWLQCYNNPSMNIIKDRNGRSIWFHGNPGPMAPKGGKMRVAKRKYVPDNPNPVTATSFRESKTAGKNHEAQGEGPLTKKQKLKSKTQIKTKSHESERPIPKTRKKTNKTITPPRRSDRLRSKDPSSEM